MSVLSLYYADLNNWGEIMQALNSHNESIGTISELATRRRGFLRHKRAATAKNDQRRAYYWALLNEIRMLVDYIAANADHTLGEIHIKDPRPPAEEMSIGAILSRLDEIDVELGHPSETAGACAIKPEDTAFLQIIRDTLNGVARPASSLTIAYTALVTGSRRSTGHQVAREAGAQGLWWDDLYRALASTNPADASCPGPVHHLARSTGVLKRRTRAGLHAEPGKSASATSEHRC
jgi:hypothetical protein